MKYFLSICFLLIIICISGRGQISSKGIKPEKDHADKTLIVENKVISDNPYLKEDLVIGDDPDEPILGTFSGLDVDSNGDIFYADWGRQCIFKFSDDKLVKKIGRSGRGPGEFQYLESIAIHNNKIYALDGGLLRISVFNTMGKVLNTIPLKKIDNPTKYGSTPDAMKVAFKKGKPLFLLDYKISYSPGSSRIKRTQKYVSVNENGEFIKMPVIEVPQNERYVKDTGSQITTLIKPFARRAIVHMGPNKSKIYYGWSDSLAIRVYNLDGTLNNTIRHPIMKIKTTKADLKAVSKDYSSSSRRALHNHPIEKYWPTFVDFIVDDNGHIWVKTYTNNRAVNRWLILNNNGEKLGSFTMSSHVILKKIQKGYAYGYRTPINGSSAIIRYKVSKKIIK